jgi:hypothetical protein
MEVQTKKQNHSKNQEKISEIAAILARGICRLENKKRSEKEQIPLDTKPFLSLHSVGSNHSQQPATL